MSWGVMRVSWECHGGVMGAGGHVDVKGGQAYLNAAQLVAFVPNARQLVHF